jgi:hypothetical protein
LLLRTLRFRGIKTCEPTEELGGWFYIGDLFPGTKWPGHEVSYSPPSVADVKNEWRYASTVVPLCQYSRAAMPVQSCRYASTVLPLCQYSRAAMQVQSCPPHPLIQYPRFTAVRKKWKIKEINSS